ncbi:AhpC/TSA family protein [Maribacter algarum]|uniref:AhpC/TSA family protein n=1 Tax=Maribacter algarum (ex Zhang et al. 2020) TaxID=2578118 RepID=A0A5S3PMT6_9FLAO|nr:TlpA disulfide reductase family protein [Maribacter algarum]TMM55803.1 AhpC/TSA family protein [Maribacter algarum]
MKKAISYFIGMLLLSSCADDSKKKGNTSTALKENAFTLIGKVSGMEDGNLYLKNTEKDSTAIIKVKDGNFEFTGKIDDLVEKRFLYIDNPNGNSNPLETLYLERGEQILSVDVENVTSLELQGSKTQQDYYDFHKGKDSLKAPYLNIFRQADSLYDRIDSLMVLKNRDADQIATLNSQLDEVDSKLDDYYDSLDNYELIWVKNNTSSYFGLEKLDDELALSPDYNQIFGKFEMFSEQLKNTKLGKSIKERLERFKSSSIGTLAPDFSTEDIYGDKMTLSDFKGKYVLLDFWATWCKPCREGNPHLIKLYKKYQSKGFEIIGIADDEKRQKLWREAIEKDGIGMWKHVLRGNGKNDTVDQTDLAELYAVGALPTKVLVDRNGIIIHRSLGSGADEEAEMDALFSEIFNGN